MLIAAHQHRVGGEVDGLLAVGRQGDGHPSGNAVGGGLGIKDDAALQGADQVEHGDILDDRTQHRLHVLGSDGVGGQHAEQRALVVHHGQGHGVLVPVQQLPGPVHRGGLVQGRRRVVVQVADLGAQVVYQHRGLEAEAVQHQLGLVADAPQPRGHVIRVAQRCAQLGIGHGRDDGVGVGVAVACDIDGFHGVTSCVL